MAGTYAIIKAKVFTENNLYEREDVTDWVSAKEKIPAAYKVAGDLIFGIIRKITKENPPPKLHEIVWSIYNRPSRHVSSFTQGKFLKGGRYSELEEGDPPIAFMYPFPTRIDTALEAYHKARRQFSR